MKLLVLSGLVNRTLHFAWFKLDHPSCFHSSNLPIKCLEGEVSVIATRQSSSDVKWRCYLESEGTESEVNKNSTVIKWQGSWKENAREDERESILFLGWIFALYLCCSPPLNLTKHSGNILSNKFKPPFLVLFIFAILVTLSVRTRRRIQWLGGLEEAERKANLTGWGQSNTIERYNR